jgi:hypothetical protein
MRSLYLAGWASWLLTTEAMLGFLVSPAGGWVTSAPRKMTGSLKTYKKDKERKNWRCGSGFSNADRV